MARALTRKERTSTRRRWHVPAPPCRPSPATIGPRWMPLRVGWRGPWPTWTRPCAWQHKRRRMRQGQARAEPPRQGARRYVLRPSAAYHGSLASSVRTATRSCGRSTVAVAGDWSPFGAVPSCSADLRLRDVGKTPSERSCATSACCPEPHATSDPARRYRAARLHAAPLSVRLSSTRPL